VEDGSLGQTYQMRSGKEKCIQELSLKSEKINTGDLGVKYRILLKYILTEK
jgi:hypothetical protein